MINTGNSLYKNQHWIKDYMYNKHNGELMHGVV